MWRIIKEIIMAILRPFMCGKSRIFPPSICDESAYFVGVKNVSIPQGTEFDLTDGVMAYDKDGGEIPFTVTPSEIQTCEVGNQTVVYQAEDVEVTRVITVEQIPNPTIYGLGSMVVGVNEAINTLNGVYAEDGNGNIIEVVCSEGASYTPTTQGTMYLHYTAEDSCGNTTEATRTVNVIGGEFTGIDDMTVTQGTDVDLRNGVTATDWMGNTVPFTVTPSEFVPCDAGEQEFTYSAIGVSDTVRTITVTQLADPTISGVAQALSVGVGEEFDPLTGVTATDGNGNPISDITVELVN